MTNKSYLFLVVIIAIISLVLQTPFILSDPDIHISGSRGVNTDEGLYTCQVRNFINHKDLTLKKTDNFVKAPLFEAILFIPFKIFGTKLLIGRLFILLISLSILLYICSYNKYYRLLAPFLFITVFCEYYIFHFFHYCLPEILSTALIFLSVFFLVESYEKKNYLKSSLLSATFISCSYYLKIQFLYVLPILPLSIMLFMLVRGTNKKLLFKQLIYTMIFLSMYFTIYFLLWYLPNKDFFNYVMANQTTNRFVEFSNLSNHLTFIRHIFLNNYYLSFFTYLFFVLFVAGIINSFMTKSIRFRLLFIALICWLLTELHKLSMTYLPTRYLISLLFPMGLIMALVLNELITIKVKNKLTYLIKIFSFLLILCLCLKNSVDYYSSIKRRTYNILEINNYLSKYDFGNRSVVGTWAPSLTWKCKAKSFPVWKDYFNDIEVIKNYNPAIIIAEIDEKDSEQAFLSRDIDLDAYADSIKYFNINYWKIKLLWINQSVYNNMYKKQQVRQNIK